MRDLAPCSEVPEGCVVGRHQQGLRRQGAHSAPPAFTLAHGASHAGSSVLPSRVQCHGPNLTLWALWSGRDSWALGDQTTQFWGAAAQVPITGLPLPLETPEAHPGGESDPTPIAVVNLVPRTLTQLLRPTALA